MRIRPPRLVLGIALAFGLCACATPPAPSGPHTVWLVGHGWHTGIVLPRSDAMTQVWPKGAHAGRARYVEVGWGEAEFYPAPHNNSGAALRALFWRNASVLHVVGFDAPVEIFFPLAQRVALELDSDAYRRLVTALGDSFERTADGRAVDIGVGLYGDSRFYRSHERYHLFNTCNVWTARKLKTAGVPLAPWRAVTTGMLLHQARHLGRLE